MLHQIDIIDRFADSTLGDVLFIFPVVIGTNKHIAMCNFGQNKFFKQKFN